MSAEHRKARRLTNVQLSDKTIWFAWLMFRRLIANNHKPGWQADSIGALIRRVKDEVAELDAADNRKDIIKEAIDVANFCMMICDNLANTVEDVPSLNPEAHS